MRVPNCLSSRLYVLSDQNHVIPFISQVRHMCNDGYEAVVMRAFQRWAHSLHHCSQHLQFCTLPDKTLRVTSPLHFTVYSHVQWGWGRHFNAASSLQCCCPSVTKGHGARYSSKCKQKRYDNACVHVTGLKLVVLYRINPVLHIIYINIYYIYNTYIYIHF